jgi:DNA-binding response OmpR family regulator
VRRITIVEDNQDLAYGLRNNLEIEGYEVEVTSDGRAGLDAVLDSPPDLVILDLMLPEMDGFRVLKTIRAKGVEVPVLILSARGEEPDKVIGFRLGADDYVTKPFGVLELLARVDAILRRTAGGAACETIGFGAVEVDPSARTVRVDEVEVQVSPKEFELLLALIRRKGAAATRVQLMREVRGHGAAIASRTVDSHVADLRRKLEVEPSRPRHILTVHKVGYRFER